MMKAILILMLMPIISSVYGSVIKPKEYKFNSGLILDLTIFIQDETLNDSDLDLILLKHLKSRLFIAWLTETQTVDDKLQNNTALAILKISNHLKKKSIDILFEDPFGILKNEDWLLSLKYGDGVSIDSKEDYLKYLALYKKYIKEIDGMRNSLDMKMIPYNKEQPLSSLWLAREMIAINSDNTREEIKKIISTAYFRDRFYLQSKFSSDHDYGFILDKYVRKMDKKNILKFR